MINQFKLLLVSIFFMIIPMSVQALDVSIVLDKGYYSSGENPLVDLKYTNSTSNIIMVPERLLPSAEFWNDTFVLDVNGQRVNYVGKFITYTSRGKLYGLKPGESVSSTIDLSKLYDLRASGVYYIYAWVLLGYRMYKSNVVDVFIEGRKNALMTKSDDTYTVEGMRSIRCSREEAIALTLAYPKAKDLIARALNRLKPLDSSNSAIKNEKYKKWFCSDESKRSWYDYVRFNWSKLNDIITTKTIKFYCGCKNAIAFVFPYKSLEIHVCRDFFELPTYTQDSQAAVIVHELSHFYVTIATKDHAYGYNTCLRLARDNPELAISNADNYKYFSSSFPYLDY